MMGPNKVLAENTSKEINAFEERSISLFRKYNASQEWAYKHIKLTGARSDVRGDRDSFGFHEDRRGYRSPPPVSAQQSMASVINASEAYDHDV